MTITTILPGRSPGARPPAHRRGQSLVEFALVLPIFLFLLFGLIDMGRFAYMHTTLSQAAREAARVVSTEAYWIGRGIAGPTFDPSCNQPGGPICPADETALKADALAAANRMMAPFGAIPAATFYLSCNATTPPSGQWSTQACPTNARSTGSLASIRVTFDVQPITPIISQMFPSISSEASATMVIN